MITGLVAIAAEHENRVKNVTHGTYEQWRERVIAARGALDFVQRMHEALALAWPGSGGAL